ncbi:MAG: glycoside hydrolase family 3 N-terminal domain-containing protein [Siphonobacter sp.]
MKRRNYFLGAWLSLFSLASNATTEPQPLYKNASAPTHRRVQDLLKRMTLEEKVGQLSTPLGWFMYEKKGSDVQVSETFKKAVKEQHIGMLWATLRADPWTQKTLTTGLTPEQAAKATNALQKYVIENTRLGIPLLLSEECPHGHMAIGTTVFPTALGQGSTWNPALIHEMAQAIAQEARLQGAHIGYGPVLDLAREPRWSRVEETYGEDPVINGQMGIAMVTGFQGKNLKSGTNIMSTLKHFAAYGVPEGGHNGGSVAPGTRELYQVYLPPFRDAVRAGALSIMTAYNSIDGIPCTANPVLLKTILRNQWGFKGFVVSDLNSIQGLKSNHHVAESNIDAAAMAINAGLNADLSGSGFDKSLIEAMKQGKVSTAVLDTAVSHVLRLKFEMGLFENPYVQPEKTHTGVKNAEHTQLARRVAQEAIVLLKNTNQLLPLRKDLKSIAVIGPNADNVYNQLGDYTAPQAEGSVITVLKGIQNKLGNTAQIRYAKGCSIRDTASNHIAEAIETARQSEVAVVVIGGSSARDFKTEYQNTGAAEVKASEVSISDMESGEGYDRASLDLMGRQLQLVDEILKTGKPVVVVLIKGRPLNLNWLSAHVPAVVDAWYPGMEGGNAIADVLFGDYNPAGRLTISVPKSVGQLPVYYNYKSPIKHDYVENDAKPLYPFGYGLSYSSFEYTNLNIQVTPAGSDVTVNVSFQVKNASNRDGDEVTQLYITDPVSSVVGPNKQLKKFQRIHLKAGEQKTITFNLHAKDLMLLNPEMKWVAERGEFNVQIGASSEDIRVKQSFQLAKDIEVKP